MFSDTNSSNDDFTNEGLTTGQRIADQVASIAGSWIFILSQLTMLLFWVCVNYVAPNTGSSTTDWYWDPYPYILLNLCLSFQAAYSTPVIMMSQNRAAEVDRYRASSLNEKVDQIRISQFIQLYDTLKGQTDQMLQLLHSVSRISKKYKRLVASANKEITCPACGTKMVKKYQHKHHGSMHIKSPEIVDMELMSGIDSLKSSLTGMRAVLSEAVGVPVAVSINAMNADRLGLAPINEIDINYNSEDTAETAIPMNVNIFTSKDDDVNGYKFQDSVASVISTTEVVGLNSNTFLDPKYISHYNVANTQTKSISPMRKARIEESFQDSINSVISAAEPVALSDITFSDPKFGDIEMGNIPKLAISERRASTHEHHTDQNEIDDIEWKEFMNNLCIQPQREMTDGEEQITFARKVTKQYDSQYEEIIYSMGAWWEKTWRSVIFRGKFIDENVTFGQQIAQIFSDNIGSWGFTISQSLFLLGWIVINVSWSGGWDVYPFILLNLCLSTQAAFSGPLILMAQNRKGEVDRRRVNEVHQSIDHIRFNQMFAMGDLLAVQNHLLNKMEVAFEKIDK